MRKAVIVLCAVAAAQVGLGVARADVFQFQPVPADLYDLDHYRFYTWGIAWNVPDDHVILAATLFIDNINNWQRAVMLLSTFEEHEPEIDTTYTYYTGGTQLLQTNSRWLDRSSDLLRDALLLIGFANIEGPVKLYTRRGDGDYRYLKPKGNTMTVYRITIPARPARGE